MSCLIPFLRKRELGQRDSTLKYKFEVCDLVEEYGAYPVKNEPCKLSRQCRATFLTDFSPDGKRIASTHGDHTVRVTEIATRKCTHVLHGHPRTPWCLAFHPSSNDILASGCLGGEVRIWDLHGGGSEVWRSKDNLVIASLTFHPTDFVLVFAVGNTLYFWDWSKSEPWVRFDPLGNNLLTGITNSTTLHQTNPSRVSYINTERQNAVNRTQSQPQSQNRLSSVYDNLVECFHAYRRERGYEPSNVLGPSDEASSSNVYPVVNETPQSPVLEEGLNLARQYASHVTETSSSQGQQRTDVAETNSSTSNGSSGHGDTDVESESRYNRPGSPPPREASNEDVDVIMEDEIVVPEVSSSTSNDEMETRSTDANTLGHYTSFRTQSTVRPIPDTVENSSSRFDTLNLGIGRGISSHVSGGSMLRLSCGHRVRDQDRHSTHNLSQSTASSLDCDSDCQVCRSFSRSHVLQSRLSAFRNSDLGNRPGVHQRMALSSRFRRYSPFSVARHRDSASFVRVAQRARQQQEENQDFTNLLHPSQTRLHGTAVNNSTENASSSAMVNQPLSVDVGASESANESNAGQHQHSSVRDTASTETTDNNNSNGESDSNINLNFATITARIQREMNELDRRINALRNTFNESIRQLQQNRESYSRLGASEREPSSQLLENALRTSPPQVHQQAQQQQQQIGDRYLDDNFGANSWHSLQRHHLHPHYAVSILDDTINRPNDALQTAINRAIAGAFMGRGEQAVANNIINQTHRIQMWDFSKCEIPDITDSEKNVVVPYCKIHNDASCDISQDGTYLAVFVPCHRGFPDDNILSVFSLLPDKRGQCLYTKSFGPNAISVSLSPRNHYVMVGLAAKRLSWVFTAKQHVTDVMHPCDTDVRTHVSVNSARWLRGVGEGIVYGTNRGDLHICKPGSKIAADGEKTDDPNISGTSIRRNLMHMLGLSAGAGPLISIATQTSGVRRSAATQTDMEEQTTE
ncbi:hypothetical protein KUTeg_007162 [Tegillarca granosa]|uniref:Activating molecule in BECN1-regulated autophagy protein 1 n=1 Tax=Tegillarca granosa TaxID=220873 RepID=A0ABQ9FGL9_TEGGR|nr:hypothetical protein KUTeg_007162 [Tegillarca granosa]